MNREEFAFGAIIQNSPDWNYKDEFEYIEGSIEEFPEALVPHVDMVGSKRYARSRWGRKRGTEQTLDTTSNGRDAKFVLNGDKSLQELAAGRFRCAGVDQVVVVGIPDEELEGGIRYVIVSLPRKARDRFERITGTRDWKGSAWNVFRPTKKFNDYYEKVPDTILRVERTAASTAKQDIGKICHTMQN